MNMMEYQDKKSGVYKMKDFNDFKTYCYNEGLTPSDYTTLKKYVDDLKSGDLIKCDCCGEITHYEHIVWARYDDVQICVQCREDGN